jgi:sulfite reductase alpha subunit-like flavoprotein
LGKNIQFSLSFSLAYRDARGMAKDVMQTLTEIFVKFGNLSQKEAMEKLASMMKNAKYVADIW